MDNSFANYRHELLTPVNHIIGYCEILIEDAEGSEQAAALAGLKTILDSGKRLLEDIESSLPSAAAAEPDIPGLRVRLRPPLRQILEACDAMQWGADAAALARFAEDLAKVRFAAASLVDLAAQAGAEESGSHANRTMPRILVAEDNEENWDILSRRLSRRGYEVLVARDGEQAIGMAHAQAPDLILMDMNLPLIDGWDATRRIKADPATQDVPIIAVTAHGMAGDREKALEAGCVDHHAKPVDLTRLLSQIEATLQKETTR